jgi:hypothetical protein
VRAAGVLCLVAAAGCSHPQPAAPAPAPRPPPACYAERDVDGSFTGVNDALAALDGSERAYVAEVSATAKDASDLARCRAGRSAAALTAGILVAPDGHVARVSILQSDARDPALHACLGEALCAWRLPSVPGRKELAFPLPIAP